MIIKPGFIRIIIINLRTNFLFQKPMVSILYPKTINAYLKYFHIKFGFTLPIYTQARAKSRV
jgi:hypothetical protein